MLLPRSTRDQLLIKINEILQNVSDVVKVLSSCQVSSQEDVMSVSSSQDELQELWWDESQSVTQLVSPIDSALYTMSFLTDDFSDAGERSQVEDKDTMEDDVFPNPSPKEEDSEVSSVSSRSREDSLSSEISSDSNTTWSGWSDSSSLISKDSQASSVIDHLISFVEVAAPGAVYNAAKSKRRRRKKCDKIVVPELRDLWRNVNAIFAPSKPRTPGPDQPSFTVDWSDVNVRSINNLPKPQMFPKLGVSQDPNFYDETKRQVETGEYRWIEYKYPIIRKTESAFAYKRETIKITGQNYPVYVPNHYNNEVKHGEEAGFMTDVGVIPVKDNVFHGHIFNADTNDWVLHAKKHDGSKEKYKKRGAKARHRYQEFAQPQDTRSPSKKRSPRFPRSPRKME